MIYIERKYIFLLLFVSISITIFLLFYYRSDTKALQKSFKTNNNIVNSTNEENNNKVNIEYFEEKITKNIKNNIINKEVPATNNKEDVEINESKNFVTNNLEFEKKNTQVFNSPTRDGNFAVTIVSDINIKKEYVGRFIPMRGKLIYKDRENPFTLSLPYDYKNHQESDLNIQISDINKGSHIKCDGYFLKALEKGYIYDLKIELHDDYADYYISNQKKLPNFKSPFDTKEGESVQIKELSGDLKLNGVNNFNPNKKE